MIFQRVTAFGRSVCFLVLFLAVPWGVTQEASASPAALPGQVPGLPPPQKPQSPGFICPAQLGGAIETITNHPQLQRGRWGILIQTLSATPQTLYARERDRYFVPASTAKLLTTAAALRRLGPQFRYRTAIYQAANPRLRILRVVGSGDPSLTDVQLGSLAQQLSRQGMRHVQQILADDHSYQGSAINPSWEWEDIQSGYGAPINSLILNQNAVELKLLPQAVGQPLRLEWADPVEAIGWPIHNRSRTVQPQDPEFVEVGRDFGSSTLQIRGQLRVGGQPETVAIAVLDPAQQFLRHLRRALRAHQITTAQTLVTSSPRPPHEREVAAVVSPPLFQLIGETNQESNNLYAESLLKTLGANPSRTADSSAAGLDVVKSSLTDLGVNPQSYVLTDGSGLSRHNLVSPEALVQTLRGMAQTPVAALYQASLPVAGVSGTLYKRFQKTPAQGILKAKTGSMSGVSTLAGYLNSPHFPPLVFSILVNQSDQSGKVLRQAIDEMVLLLTRLRSC